MRRSPLGLIKAMDYINKFIIDSDKKSQKELLFPIPNGGKKVEFKEIYSFLWDRMR